MKALPVLALGALFSGCSHLTREPSEARQRKLEQDARGHERADPLRARAEVIEAQARQYENRRFSEAEARAKAIAHAWPKPKS